MVKRLRDDTPEGPPFKRLRNSSTDRLSSLSDELLIRVLSFVGVPSLLTCQTVSKKLYALAGDSQLWKAAYYNRFVRPRAARLPGIKDTTPENLRFSSKLSKWLDDENLVKKGGETNWKQQYKIRHNWSRGSCGVSEIEVAEEPPVPPLLVRMQDGVIFTVDSVGGLRAWSLKQHKLLASKAFKDGLSPTALAVDNNTQEAGTHHVAVGFEDGSYNIYGFQEASGRLLDIFSHAASSNGTISAVALASPYMLTMTSKQLLSIYRFPAEKRIPDSEILDPPRLLHSLKSHTVGFPLALAIRIAPEQVIASVAYAVPTFFSGWSVGLQEFHLSIEGEILQSRLASGSGQLYQSLLTASSLNVRSPSHILGLNQETRIRPPAKPTSLSYSHPYLLLSHPDNTLTLYLVSSTLSSLSIGPGSRLWGHTSSVSSAHIGGRGKAVSVSARGDELRVWELEGGMISSATRRRLNIGDASVRIRPELRRSASEQDIIADAVAKRGTGLGLALEHKIDDLSITRGWVGFDDENVIVLKEKQHGSQSLVVYDFT